MNFKVIGWFDSTRVWTIFKDKRRMIISVGHPIWGHITYVSWSMCDVTELLAISQGLGITQWCSDQTLPTGWNWNSQCQEEGRWFSWNVSILRYIKYSCKGYRYGIHGGRSLGWRYIMEIWRALFQSVIRAIPKIWACNVNSKFIYCDLEKNFSHMYTWCIMYYGSIKARRGILVVIFYYFFIIGTPSCESGATISPNCYYWACPPSLATEICCFRQGPFMP